MEVKQGEVVLCQFYFSDSKQAKNRPVLVYKDNLPFDDFIGIPISSKSIQYSDELPINNSEFLLGSLPKPSKSKRTPMFLHRRCPQALSSQMHENFNEIQSRRGFVQPIWLDKAAYRPAL